ncbi:MAG: DsrE family protein [Planctomycetales bacterium]|nr:DsrE family protein [Planctomycetales bacterium]
MHRPLVLLVALASLAAFAPLSAAQPFGRGPGGPGHGGGHGPGNDERFVADRDDFHFLLENHAKIVRTVTETAKGVETLTESKDPDIAAKIKEHVYWMKERIEKGNPIRRRDPLFDELFQHTEKIKMEFEDTDDGVRVVETSDDPYVARLIQAHARTVSLFAERGFNEAMKNHSVPPRKGDAAATGAAADSGAPVIANYGKVVPLPNAAQQPRPGSQIIVDMTSGGPDRELNPGLDRVARFLNLYAAAGKRPADVELVLVLHGAATDAALANDAYAARRNGAENPNFECLHELHEAGVEIFVCGQSLHAEGSTPEDVLVFVDVAVSAVTTLVNFQEDGYVCLPVAN